MKAVLLRSKAIKLRLQFEPDNFQFMELTISYFIIRKYHNYN